jgi:hypothetical protein
VDEDVEIGPTEKSEVLATLRTKVEEGWINRLCTVEKNRSLWVSNPSAFFGTTKFTSSEQWSFVSLYNIERKLYLNRRPFHEVHLAERLVELVKVKGNERSARMHLLANIYLAFESTDENGDEKLDEKEKRKIRKRFERYITSGLILRSMMCLSVGFLLTVAWFLTDK